MLLGRRMLRCVWPASILCSPKSESRARASAAQVSLAALQALGSELHELTSKHSATLAAEGSFESSWALFEGRVGEPLASAADGR